MPLKSGLPAIRDRPVTAGDFAGADFAVPWAKTGEELRTVKTAVNALLGVSNHVGIVINRVNLAKHARYGYGDHGDYYSRYRGYYGTGTETPASPTRPSLTLAKR